MSIENIRLKYAYVAPEIWATLDTILRTGWVNKKVQDPESVQEHTISLMKIAASLEDLSPEEQEGLDDMLEVHDWPEVIHGGEVIYTFDENERERLSATKFENEYVALQTLCKYLGSVGQKIITLWLRFEQSTDAAAVLAREIDKYQAIEKALEYEESQGIPVFKEFYEYSASKIKHPQLKERLDSLYEKWQSTKNSPNLSHTSL